MKFTTFVLCLFTLALCILSSAKSAHAQNNIASVYIGSFEDYGALTPRAVLIYDDNGFDVFATQTGVTASHPLDSRSRNGTTLGGLTNNTSSTITLSTPASVGFTANAELESPGTASAEIKLGFTTASAFTTDEDDSISQSKFQEYTVVSLAPGQYVGLEGTFRVYVDCDF